jgi:WD repeat-containing protein 24
MGQRGLLDRLPVAHSGPVMTIDWCNAPSGGNSPITLSGDSSVGSGLGWVVSGGLDRCVKVCYYFFSPSSD